MTPIMMTLSRMTPIRMALIRMTPIQMAFLRMTPNKKTFSRKIHIRMTFKIMTFSILMLIGMTPIRVKNDSVILSRMTSAE
jgi:hypothetical protein